MRRQIFLVVDGAVQTVAVYSNIEAAYLHRYRNPTKNLEIIISDMYDQYREYRESSGA